MRTRANPVYCGVDTTDLAHATRLIQLIAGGPNPAVGGIKLGLEFFLAHGAPGVRYAFPTPVRATGVGFFLDLKLHDIPNTVAGGIRAVVELEPTYITIHVQGGREMLRVAVAEAAEGAARLGVARPRLLGVTVLTSLDRSDLEATGVPADPSDQVLRLAGLARECGLDGVICSPLEIAALRKACGPDFVLMVPGIRPVGSAIDDQKRAMTPRQAVDLGATHLVVGRPICKAGDPRAAAEAIAREAGVNQL
ncbi:MAG: orotidine-5'-phosphate decarboxylase [Reyranella sp.]|uniref:orotidine-5'-phosphate decarboxylase n=1 Tax=Reyranella sp. TaxID=1929291 RepID=UPI003D116BE9